MANIVIDLLGDEEEKDLSNKKKAKPESEVKPRPREVRRQIINIAGEIVDL